MVFFRSAQDIAKTNTTTHLDPDGALASLSRFMDDASVNYAEVAKFDDGTIRVRTQTIRSDRPKKKRTKERT